MYSEENITIDVFTGEGSTDDSRNNTDSSRKSLRKIGKMLNLPSTFTLETRGLKYVFSASELENCSGVA